jgi:hypothetical protein
MASQRELPHRAAFEQMGETQVRFECAQRDGEVGKAAVAWLAEQQILRDEAAASKRDAREEETLAIARSALANSRRSNIIAISAIVFATITAIIAAIIGVNLGK